MNCGINPDSLYSLIVLRVNNWSIKTYEGVKDWIRKVYDDEFPEDGIQEGLQSHIAFCLGIIREHLRGQFPYSKYSVEGALFEKLRKEIKLAYSIIPPKNPSEAEIIKCAKDSYFNIYEKIWSSYEKIVDAPRKSPYSPFFPVVSTNYEDFSFEFHLSESEDKINQKLMGRFISYPVNKFIKKKLETEISEFKKELKKIREGYKSKYDYVYDQVAQHIGLVYRRLAKILLPRRYPKWENGYASGSRLNLKELMKFESEGDYSSLWQRKAKPIKTDYRFCILVDLSGSMVGVKISETLKALILLVEVLDKLAIPIEIMGFHEDEVKLFKSFEEKLNDVVRNKIAMIVEGIGGRTNTDKATEIASNRLMHYHSKEKFLITFTDGKPDFTRRARTRALINKIVNERKQKLIGIGLGPINKIKDVRLYYPETILVENVCKLPEVMCVAIRKYIR